LELKAQIGLLKNAAAEAEQIMEELRIEKET